MKKLLFVFGIGLACLCLFAQMVSEDDLYYRYKGPHDDAIVYYDHSHYWYKRNETTFGRLAKYSDIIAIGHVVTQDVDKIMVTVDTPVVGCTNRQSVAIYHRVTDGTPDDFELHPELFVGMPTLPRITPTNNAQIVFCVYSNLFDQIFNGYIDWRGDQQPYQDSTTFPQYQFMHNERSWWYVDRDNGLLRDHFTNVVQAVRMDRNWTNYFHLCRDGANMNSIRIKEDSYYDMEKFCIFSNTNQMNFINADPLVLPEHKVFLTIEYLPMMWIYKNNQ